MQSTTSPSFNHVPSLIPSAAPSTTIPTSVPTYSQSLSDPFHPTVEQIISSKTPSISQTKVPIHNLTAVTSTHPSTHSSNPSNSTGIPSINPTTVPSLKTVTISPTIAPSNPATPSPYNSTLIPSISPGNNVFVSLDQSSIILGSANCSIINSQSNYQQTIIATNAIAMNISEQNIIYIGCNDTTTSSSKTSTLRMLSVMISAVQVTTRSYLTWGSVLSKIDEGSHSIDELAQLAAKYYINKLETCMASGDYQKILHLQANQTGATSLHSAIVANISIAKLEIISRPTFPTLDPSRSPSPEVVHNTAQTSNLVIIAASCGAGVLLLLISCGVGMYMRRKHVADKYTATDHPVVTIDNNKSEDINGVEFNINRAPVDIKLSFKKKKSKNRSNNNPVDIHVDTFIQPIDEMRYMAAEDRIKYIDSVYSSRRKINDRMKAKKPNVIVGPIDEYYDKVQRNENITNVARAIIAGSQKGSKEAGDQSNYTLPQFKQEIRL